MTGSVPSDRHYKINLILINGGVKMLKLRKKLLIGILTAAIALSATQTVVWSDAEEEPVDETVAAEETADDAAASEDTGSDEASDGEEEVVLVTDEEALAKCSLKAENSKFALYVNEEEATFGLLVKSNGYIWWSSPINADNDQIAKGVQIKTMKSMFYMNTGDPVVHRSTKYTSFEHSVSKKSFTVDDIENGVKFTYNFARTEMSIPMEIVLEEDGLSVTIPTSEITEDLAESTTEGGAALLDINFLASFGAGGLDETGYMVVPDGSGAVINFNNKKTNTTVYSAQVYGRDLTVNQLTAPAIDEQIYLPVLGMVKKGDSGDNAFLAVVTQGDSYAHVNASVSEQSTTSYNSVWFSFDCRTQDTFYMGSANKELNVYEAGDIKVGDLTVKYYPITGDDLSYSDLADIYRNYLVNEKGVTKKTTANDAPYYLTLDGGTMKSQSIAGFPIEMETAATTYEQALEIIGALESNGVDSMIVDYKDFNAAGIVGMIPAAVDYSGTLGGKDDFNKLKEYAAAKNYKLFPSVDIMEYYRSGNGYSFTLNAAIQISKSYASQNEYDLAFGIPHQTKSSWMVLSPYYWTDLFKKLSDSFTKEGITGIALKQATSTLYSDFSRYNLENRRYILRGDAQQILVNGYQQIKNAGMSLYGEAANAYALPYVDYLSDVPLYSSDYDLFDYDIPFYSMVIHGLVPYTTKAINSNADAQELRLLALATGTPLHYELMYTNPNKFTDSEYDDLYYTNYQGWIERSASEFQLFKDVVSGVSDAEITDYNRMNAKEIEVTYSNGTVIYVNLSNNVIKVNGSEFKLADYGLEGVIE